MKPKLKEDDVFIVQMSAKDAATILTGLSILANRPFDPYYNHAADGQGIPRPFQGDDVHAVAARLSQQMILPEKPQ